MDPLSIASAVVGLLKTAQEVSSVITKLVSIHKNGAREIRDIKIAVDTLRSIILQLQLLLLNHAKIDDERASMILVEEIVVTLTACVMTFSDLDSCVEGLESDNRLGILDTVRWASKSVELKAHLQNLEAHKTTLGLMVNMLSCQSTQKLENDAAQLKVLMLRVLESNSRLTDRMSMLESAQGNLINIWQDHETASVLSDRTVAGPSTEIFVPQPLDAPRCLLTSRAFEDDLNKSWVYKRSVARGPRTFSVATSKRLSQITQSWSLISGVSLSKVSNVAIQSLPIFSDDLKENHLYNFGDSDAKVAVSLEDYVQVHYQDNARSTTRAKIPIEHLFLKPSQSQTEPPDFQSNNDWKRGEEMLTTSEESPNQLESLVPSAVNSLPIPELLTPPVAKLGMETSVVAEPQVEEQKSGLLVTESPDTTSKHAGETQFSLNSTSKDQVLLSEWDTLYIAASLFAFHIDNNKYSGGFQYLMYEPGEIFDVIGEKGELWLAKNQDDPKGEFGWIWNEHFCRLPLGREVHCGDIMESLSSQG